MKRFFIILLSVFYTFVSVGATFQIHRCSGNVSWAVSSEKIAHDSCPLCHSAEDQACDPTNRCKGDCEDMELKFDQLSDTFLSLTKDQAPSFDPAITVIPWIQEILSFFLNPDAAIRNSVLPANAGSSPPAYLFHCIFRI